MDLQQLWRDAYMAQLSRTANSGAARVAADRAVADYRAANPDTPTDGLKPVYRLRNGSNYLYTVSETERDNAVSQYGYVYEGVAFYAYEAP